MAAGRAARRRPERSKAYQESPRDVSDVVRQMMAETATRWIEQSKGTAREDVARALSETTPILAKHWSQVLDRTWKTYAEPPKGKDPWEIQKDLQLSFVVSMNEMMKEVMGTEAFARLSGQSVETFLQSKIASDRTAEETLKALRIPTKTDIDDIHQTLYSLGKRIDLLSASLLTRTGAPSEGRRSKR